MERVTIYVKWRQIEDFPDYYISNTGLFRYCKAFVKPRLRRGRKDYYWVITRNNKGWFKRHDIHRLVWDYFGSEPHKKGFELHHKDLNPQNNHIDNLELLPMLVHKALHPRGKKAA